MLGISARSTYNGIPDTLFAACFLTAFFLETWFAREECSAEGYSKAAKGVLDLATLPKNVAQMLSHQTDVGLPILFSSSRDPKASAFAEMVS